MQTIPASPQHPFLLWTYRGTTYATDKIVVRTSDTLRGVSERFWKRLIKPSVCGRVTRYNRGSRLCKKKEIFFSYQLLPMIHKNLKVSVRVKPFPLNRVDSFI